MNEEGIHIIRAIAYSEKHLPSEIFTSQRFYVVENLNQPEPIYNLAPPIETVIYRYLILKKFFN